MRAENARIAAQMKPADTTGNDDVDAQDQSEDVSQDSSQAADPAQLDMGFAPERNAPPQQEEPPAAESEDAAESHRYKVLQGKYNAETKRLREQNQQLEVRMNQMQDLLANLSKAQPRAPEPEAPKTPPKPEFEPVSVQVTPLSERERQEYGDDLLEAVYRHVMHKLEPIIQKVNQNLSTLNEKTGKIEVSTQKTHNTTERAVRDRVFEKLDQMVPGWRDIDKDEAFGEWLKQEDGLSGQPRGVLLQAAFRNNDANRLARFFQQYKAEHATGDDEHAQSAEPAEAPRKAAVDPRALVSPGRGRAAPRSGAQQEKIVWTPAGIAAFYRDVQDGRYKNNLAERDRLEADIYAAQHENRVRA